MKLVIGSDHRGFLLKEHVKLSLAKEINFLDIGCYSAESVDYPVVSKNLVLSLKELAEQNSDNNINNTFGVIICGSGVGVSIAVNKFPFIRGALVFNEEIAKSSREHNNSNVICLPADYLSQNQAVQLIKTFISTAFEGGRHENRVKELSNLFC